MSVILFKAVTLRDSRFVKDAKNITGAHMSALSPSPPSLPSPPSFYPSFCPLVFQAIYLCIHSMKCEMRDYKDILVMMLQLEFHFIHQFNLCYLSSYHVLYAR